MYFDSAITFSLKDSKKPQVTCCKIEDLDELKTLLRQQGITLSIDKATAVKLVKHWDLESMTHGLAAPQLAKIGLGRVAQYGHTSP